MTHHPIRSQVGLAGAAALLLAGCTTVGPDYAKPDVPAPQAFRGATDAHAGPTSFADAPWTDVFTDPALRSLIEAGLANNQDLQVAAARIARARAMVGVAKSEKQPQVSYNVGGGGADTFTADTNSVGTTTVGSIGGALQLAWEFDVWGRIRRSTESAQANLMAEEDIRRGVQLTLVGEIAAGYYRLLELDREMAIAEDSARVYGQTFDLFNKRFEGGRDSRLPVDRSQAAVESSTAKVEEIRRLVAIQENALSVLVGGYPGAIARGQSLLDQPLPQTATGSTTALLQRRPDVLAAEQRMIQANADVGVAIANKFPRIGLSALVGGIDANVEGNWSGFGVWNAALSAAGPIFTGGRLESIEQERRAHFQETVAQYRQTVLTAFQETSDALAAQDTLARRRAALERQVESLRRSSDLALTRFDSGRASYFEVLEAQQQLFPVEDQLAQTRRDQLVATVNLYKALGGGWQGPATATATPGN